jgi:SAM-dependent methyltransferase
MQVDPRPVGRTRMADLEVERRYGSKILAGIRGQKSRERLAKDKQGERRSKLFYAENNPDSHHSGRERWDEVRKLADFRPGDRVLDVGCAEGWIALEAARLVHHVDAFDISLHHITEAGRLAAEQGIGNVAFEVASIDDYPFEPRSHEVVLFLSVYGKPLGEQRTIGVEHLGRVLEATRRQLLMKVGVQGVGHKEVRLQEILETFEAAGFDSLCLSIVRGRRMLGNWILAHRRGTDARTGELPALAVLPTALLRDHPVVRSAASIAGTVSSGERGGERSGHPALTEAQTARGSI